MPELPEVEVTRLGLYPHLIGQKITGIIVRQPRLRWPVPADIEQSVNNTWITQLTRRGKYLLIELSHKTATRGVAKSKVLAGTQIDAHNKIRGWLIFHLGMSGTLRFIASNEPPSVHDHIDLLLGAQALRLRDPRRFGALLWHPISAGDINIHPLLAHLGVEPLSPEFADHLGAQHLYDKSRGRTQSIKQLLLAGKVVVGVGNIYASEALFAAGIDPRTRAGRISLSRYQRLAQAIRTILSASITRGGSSLRDFVGSDGSQGYFQLDCMVYGRAEQPCRHCQTPIKQITLGQRSSFYCPQCQHV